MLGVGEGVGKGEGAGLKALVANKGDASPVFPFKGRTAAILILFAIAYTPIHSTSRDAGGAG